MSWRIRQHYGFGAASVELAAEPHFVAHRSLRIWPSMRDAGRDFYTTSLPPLLMAALMIVALFVTVSTDRGYTDLEVVMIAEQPLQLAEELPEPEPLLPEPEPIREPEPPPPEPVAQAKPEPPRPSPLKRVAPKAPPPPQRVARQKPAPPPKAKPKAPPVKPRYEALALQPPKPAVPPPTRRGNRVREQVAKPKVALAPIAQAPKLPDAPQESQSRRFAAVRAPKPDSRPRADLGPPIAARALDAPAPAPPPARTRRTAPTDPAQRSVAKVSFAAATPAPTAPGVPDPAARRSRVSPRPEPSRRGAPPPMEMAAVAPAAPQLDLPGSGRRAAAGPRTQRNDTTRTRSDHLGGRELDAVPLASLAACVSVRDEEALKRRLLAAVTTQRECVSRAGTYRFVETKNLNAFLMTIERAPGRPVADRCTELEHALACVSR